MKGRRDVGGCMHARASASHPSPLPQVDQIDSPDNEFSVACMDLVGQFSRLAKADGYRCVGVPAKAGSNMRAAPSPPPHRTRRTHFVSKLIHYACTTGAAFAVRRKPWTS